MVSFFYLRMGYLSHRKEMHIEGLFKRKLLPPVLLILSLSITACFHNNETKACIESDIDLGQKEKEALQTKLFTKGFWPEKDWWVTFQDEQLNQFIAAAIQDSPSLKSVESRITEAKQEVLIAKSTLLPQVGALFNYFGAYFSKELLKEIQSPMDPWFQLDTIGLDFSYQFDFWGRNRRLIEVAVGEVKVNEALFAQTKLILSTSIASVYFELQANIVSRQIIEEILNNRLKTLELFNLRKVNRIDNQIDTNLIQEEVLLFQKALTAIQEEITLGKNLLTTLIGKNPGETLPVAPNWSGGNIVIDLPENIGLDLLVRRPDLASQIWTISEASKYVGIALTNFFPNVDLQALGGWQGSKIEQLFQSKSITGGILPFIRLPLFEGGRLRAYYKAKIAAYESQIHQYNNLLLTAANEVVSSITKLTSVNEKLIYQKETVSFTHQNYDLVYTRYRHGIDSMIAVLRENEKYLVAKLGQIELEKMRYLATVAVIKSLGGGFEDEKAREISQEGRGK